MKKILIAISLLMCVVQALPLDGYDTYYNGRFGFKVSYPSIRIDNDYDPSIFIPTGTPVNMDGQYFVQSNGQAFIHAYASWNGIRDADDGEVALSDGMIDLCNLTNLLSQENRLDKLTYKRQKGNVAIYSGYYGRDIIYVKAIAANSPEGNDEIFSGRRCAILRIQYPADQKEAYDDIVKHVSESFQALD